MSRIAILNSLHHATVHSIAVAVHAPHTRRWSNPLKSTRYPFLTLSALAALPVIGHGQTLSEVIQQNEQKIWQSFVGSHPDTEAFARMVLPDYRCIEFTGVLMDKEANVAQLKQLTFSSFRIEDPQVRRLSPTSALIIGRVRFAGTAGGKSMSGEVLTSTVWVRRGAQWRVQLHTETPVPEKNP
jgi:hypothetical protein